jgi:hypothetical protein
VASSTDNNWTDVAVDDAHVYAGTPTTTTSSGSAGAVWTTTTSASGAWPTRCAARRPDLAQYFSAFPDFFVNAFYAGGGVMVYGVGLPPDVTLRGQAWNYLSGARWMSSLTS